MALEVRPRTRNFSQSKLQRLFFLLSMLIFPFDVVGGVQFSFLSWKRAYTHKHLLFLFSSCSSGEMEAKQEAALPGHPDILGNGPG